MTARGSRTPCANTAAALCCAFSRSPVHRPVPCGRRPSGDRGGALFARLVVSQRRSHRDPMSRHANRAPLLARFDDAPLLRTPRLFASEPYCPSDFASEPPGRRDPKTALAGERWVPRARVIDPAQRGRRRLGGSTGGRRAYRAPIDSRSPRRRRGSSCRKSPSCLSRRPCRDRGRI